MAEQKNNMTDRQLAEELQKGKRGGLGGRLLEILGVVVIAAGAVFGGSVPRSSRARCWPVSASGCGASPRARPTG